MQEEVRRLWGTQAPRGVLCWYCCHSFDNIPAYLPISKANGKAPLVLTGYFCSWNCVKAYALDKRKELSYIGLLAFVTAYKPQHCIHTEKMCICLDKSRRYLKPAPNRECLEAFGGDISIEEYRKGFWIIKDGWDIRYEHRICIQQQRQVKVVKLIESPFVVKTKKRFNKL